MLWVILDVGFIHFEAISSFVFFQVCFCHHLIVNLSISRLCSVSRAVLTITTQVILKATAFHVSNPHIL